MEWALVLAVVVSIFLIPKIGPNQDPRGSKKKYNPAWLLKILVPVPIIYFLGFILHHLGLL